MFAKSTANREAQTTLFVTRRTSGGARRATPATFRQRQLARISRSNQWRDVLAPRLLHILVAVIRDLLTIARLSRSHLFNGILRDPLAHIYMYTRINAPPEYAREYNRAAQCKLGSSGRSGAVCMRATHCRAMTRRRVYKDDRMWALAEWLWTHDSDAEDADEPTLPLSVPQDNEHTWCADSQPLPDPLAPLVFRVPHPAASDILLDLPANGMTFIELRKRSCDLVDKYLEVYAPHYAVFKIGITTDFNVRFRSYREGGWYCMIVLAAASDAKTVESLEKCLISEYKCRRGCYNERPGGEGGIGVRFPRATYYTYVVTQSAACGHRVEP